MFENIHSDNEARTRIVLRGCCRVRAREAGDCCVDGAVMFFFCVRKRANRFASTFIYGGIVCPGQDAAHACVHGRSDWSVSKAIDNLHNALCYGYIVCCAVLFDTTAVVAI